MFLKAGSGTLRGLLPWYHYGSRDIDQSAQLAIYTIRMVGGRPTHGYHLGRYGNCSEADSFSRRYLLQDGFGQIHFHRAGKSCAQPASHTVLEGAAVHVLRSRHLCKVSHTPSQKEISVKDIIAGWKDARKLQDTQFTDSDISRMLTYRKDVENNMEVYGLDVLVSKTVFSRFQFQALTAAWHGHPVAGRLCLLRWQGVTRSRWYIPWMPVCIPGRIQNKPVVLRLPSAWKKQCALRAYQASSREDGIYRRGVRISRLQPSMTMDCLSPVHPGETGISRFQNSKERSPPPGRGRICISESQRYLLTDNLVYLKYLPLPGNQARGVPSFRSCCLHNAKNHRITPVPFPVS